MNEAPLCDRWGCSEPAEGSQYFRGFMRYCFRCGMAHKKAKKRGERICTDCHVLPISRKNPPAFQDICASCYEGLKHWDPDTGYQGHDARESMG